MTEILNNWLTRLWDWIDTRGVIRRTVLAVTIWMTFWVTANMVTLAFDALRGRQIDMALVALVTALTAPIMAMGGYVFKLYLDSRGKSE